MKQPPFSGATANEFRPGNDPTWAPTSKSARTERELCAENRHLRSEVSHLNINQIGDFSVIKFVDLTVGTSNIKISSPSERTPSSCSFDINKDSRRTVLCIFPSEGALTLINDGLFALQVLLSAPLLTSEPWHLVPAAPSHRPSEPSQ